MREPRPAWPDTHTDRLKEHWAAGFSASQIAGMLCREFADASYTRNSVIGKVNRLGLSGRARPSAPRRATAPHPRLVTRAKPKGVMVLPRLQGGSCTAKAVANRIANNEAKANPPESVVRADRYFEPLQGCVPVAFGAGGCKWPVGGEGADMLQCGAKRGGEGPYCPAHAKVAYQPFAKGSAKTGNELARQLRRYAA